MQAGILLTSSWEWGGGANLLYNSAIEHFQQAYEIRIGTHTLLHFEEIIKFGSFIFNSVLLYERSSLLQGEVCHIELHQF